MHYSIMKEAENYEFDNSLSDYLVLKFSTVAVTKETVIALVNTVASIDSDWTAKEIILDSF